MLNEAKTSRPRPRPGLWGRGLGRGRKYLWKKYQKLYFVIVYNIWFKITAGKFNTIPEFYTIFARKMPDYITRQRDRGQVEAKASRPRPKLTSLERKVETAQVAQLAQRLGKYRTGLSWQLDFVVAARTERTITVKSFSCRLRLLTVVPVQPSVYTLSGNRTFLVIAHLYGTIFTSVVQQLVSMDYIRHKLTDFHSEHIKRHINNVHISLRWSKR